MHSQIKAIIFDIGGVLDKGDMTKHYNNLCKELKIDAKHFRKIWKKHVKEANRGKISTKEYLSAIAKEAGLKYNELLDKWIKNKRKNLKKDKEVERIIKTLKRTGYKIGSLSNVTELHHRLRLEKNLYDHFDLNVLSFKEGFRKPDPRIYKILIRRLRLNPQQIVFIDDYKECIKTAKKLGMNTILFKNHKQLIKELKKLRLLV